VWSAKRDTPGSQTLATSLKTCEDFLAALQAAPLYTREKFR